MNQHKAEFGLVSDTPIVVYVKEPKANFFCATTIEEAVKLVITDEDTIYVWSEGKWCEAIFTATLAKLPQRENVIKGFSPR